MKSFRAAAGRIVRQEYSSTNEPLRLLGAQDVHAREVTGDADAWRMRLMSLAAIGGYDGIAVLATAPARLTLTHNVADPAALAGALAGIAEPLRRYGNAMPVPSSIALADGRVGAFVLAAPLNRVAGVEGMLVAVRAGRIFDAADALTASSISALIAVEVGRAGADRQDAQTRREALALFELARIGLSRDPLEEKLQTTVEMLAGTLGHDLVQLWLLRAGGSLRLRAARPRESLVLEIARPRDNSTLARALGGEVVAGADPSLRSWVRRTARGLTVAPIGADGVTAGVVIFGRWRDARAADDLEMARLCGNFIARIVARDPHGDTALGGPHVVLDAGSSRTGS